MTGTTLPGAPLLGELIGGEPFNPAGPEFATWLNDKLLRTVAISVVTLTEDTGAVLADNGSAFFLDGWTLSLDEASILTDGWHVDVLGPGTIEPSSGEGDAVVLAAGSSARVLCDGAAVFVLQGGGGSGGGAIDLVPIGAWDIGDTYATNEAVSFGGSSYVSIVDDNIGNQPDTSPGEWMLLAERGEQGEAGNDGASGTDGTNGTDGADGDDGREVELQSGTTHIQWRYEGDVSWTDLIAKADLKGDTGDAGGDGADGDNGWSPVLALASDGSRRVLQVDDWVGGEGTKPATGDYIGPSGLTSVIGDAVDIRGPAGAGSGDVNTSGSVTTQRLVRYADGTGDTIEDAGYTVAGVLSTDNHTDGTTNKVFTATEKTKLAGIATGATTNSSDATLLARANHTGTQLAATISDFATAADARVSAAIGVTVQAYSANLTTWAGIAPSANVQSIAGAANYAAIRALLDLEAGTDFYSISAANAAFAAASHTHTVSQLSDATANGRSLISSANYASMRGLLDLEAGTDFYSISAANAAFAAASHTHTVSALSDASANARSFLQAANYAAMKVLLSLAKADVGLGNVDNTSNATERGAAATLSGKTLVNPIIDGCVVEDVYTITDGAGFAINPRNGSLQEITLGANRTPVASSFNSGDSVTLRIADGTAFTITWTTVGVVWKGGTAPTLATSGWTVVELWKEGSTIRGAVVGDFAS